MQTTPTDNTTPLISFIVTCYDIPADMLKACISSLCRLTLTDAEREIIVVDDGSAIPAINDIKEFMPDIIYLWQSNRGLSCARNIGLQVATGRFIQFVDGDDGLIQNTYMHCLDIVRYHQPDVVLFGQTSSPKTSISYKFDGPMTGAAYMHNHNLCGSAWGYIFRRQLLGDLRFKPGILHEDEDFTPRLLLRADHLYATKVKAYFYRKREKSIMHNQDPDFTDRRMGDALQVILGLKELAQQLPEDERVALNRRVAQLTMDHIYNTIRLTHSGQRLDDTLKTLSTHGLFPLPDKNYTHKYRLFRRLSQSAIGRHLLLICIK